MKHGHAFVGKVTAEYRAWQGMRKRCYNERCQSYPCYGGRGITVCAEWLASFERFLSDVGHRPGKGYSLDRIDTNGNYTPGNVRWATKAEQSVNRRRTRFLTHGGLTLCITDWAKRIGISEFALRWRVKKWGTVRALTAPVKPGRRSWT